MFTAEELRQLMEILATKQDLENLATKDEFENLKNSVYNKMDSVYKEVLDMRKEQAAHFQQHEDLDEEIKAIKAIPAIAHQLKKS